VSRHYLVHLAACEKDAKSICSIVAATVGGGRGVGQGAEDVVCEQKLWAIEMPDNVWYW